MEKEEAMPKRAQKTYSLPEKLIEWIDMFYNENEEPLSRIGINNKSQLVAALVKNGQGSLEKIIKAVKE